MIQLVSPDLSIEAQAGSCLLFVQNVYGAPAQYKSAWAAWNGTSLKHSDGLPDVSVPVWFSHYGFYGEPGQEVYDNWGHVVAYVPSRGFLSSPAKGYGQQWLATIEEVERTFNSKYVGWSEDINGLQVAKKSDDIPEEDEMPNSQYFIASSNNKSGTIKKGDIWVRGFPGAPLTALTSGQAHDWFALQMLDFNARNVYSKDGAWFDAAFAEDVQAANLTKKVHGA